MKALVVGAAPDSLGEAICSALASDPLCEIVTAGIDHRHDHQMDVTREYDVERVLNIVRPTHIVCTVGVNEPTTFRELGAERVLRRAMDVNYFGPMLLLREWLTHYKGLQNQEMFVAVSSNSAHIARSNSAAYCASKAALSMGLRCVSRELGARPIVWAYEPGFIQDTPMSSVTAQRFDGPLHRIPHLSGRVGLDKGRVAQHLVALMLNGGDELNGTTIRMDGGEQ